MFKPRSYSRTRVYVGVRAGMTWMLRASMIRTWIETRACGTSLGERLKSSGGCFFSSFLAACSFLFSPVSRYASLFVSQTICGGGTSIALSTVSLCQGPCRSFFGLEDRTAHFPSVPLCLNQAFEGAFAAAAVTRRQAAASASTSAPATAHLQGKFRNAWMPIFAGLPF